MRVDDLYKNNEMPKVYANENVKSVIIRIIQDISIKLCARKDLSIFLK